MSEGNSMSVEQRLQELEDERAILDTFYRYSSALDYGSEDEWLSCWTKDAVYKLPGREPRIGTEELLAQFRISPHAPEKYQKHVISNPRVTVSGDSAEASSYFALFGMEAEGACIITYGHYQDKLVRDEDGGWRISERVAEAEGRRPAIA